MDISFERPWFLLLIPVVIGLLIFSMRYMIAQNKRTRISQVIVRSVLAMALVLALAQVSVKWVGRDVTTIFLVDVSDSVREQREEVIRFVNDAVQEKGKHDYVGVVAFGSDSRVEQFISQDISFAEFQTDVTTEATDIEEAIYIALAEMPEDSAKRIVLITDGNENEGSIRNTASMVVAAGCDFEVKKLEENIANEVYVSDMSIPEEVGIGENFNINVEVESNVACPAVVSLYSGRTLKGQQSVNLQEGTNRFVFMDTQTDEGLKTYRVTVEAVEDTVSINNEFSAYTNIEVELPLLLVEGADGQAKEFKGILDSIGVKYDCVVPATVPATLSEFTEYSAIVFIDVYADDLRDGFMDNLQTYVKNYGGGFIVTGGQNSFALGNYRDTVIEEVLPVHMELQGENEVPVMALQMVIDQSGSMSDGNGIITNLDLAKEAANAAVENVRDTDYVGVMAFDDSFDRVVPLQIAEDKGEISNKIFSIGIDGGTSIYPALLAAATDVSETDAQIKHIILLTDGQDTYGNYEELKKTINDAGITLSTVAVGTGCNDTLLRDLAESCNGRYFYTDITTDIPRIFAQEVFLSSNTYLVNETFTPIVTSNDAIIRDVVVDGLPSLKGYVATTPKERSIQLLQSHYGDPILSYWQYGLGKTVVWTSDVTGEWSGNYSGWENTQLLWHNIIQYVTQDMGMEGAYVEVEQNGSRSEIHYTTEDFSANTSVVATVFDDAGNATEITLDPVKPGEYIAGIDTPTTGVYTINVQQKEGTEIVSSMNTAAINQYSLEYRFYPDNTLMEEYVASVGGRIITDASEVFASQPEHVKSRWNLSTILLVMAAVWFLWDIAVRRFHLDLYKLIPVEKWKSKQEERKAKAEEKRIQQEEKKAAKSEKKRSQNAAIVAGDMMEQRGYESPRQNVAETSQPVNRNQNIAAQVNKQMQEARMPQQPTGMQGRRMPQQPTGMQGGRMPQQPMGMQGGRMPQQPGGMQGGRMPQQPGGMQGAGIPQPQQRPYGNAPMQSAGRNTGVRVWTKGGGEATQAPMSTKPSRNMPSSNIGNNRNSNKKELLNTQALLRGLGEDE